jgi:hypothetical protein
MNERNRKVHYIYSIPGLLVVYPQIVACMSSVTRGGRSQFLAIDCMILQTSLYDRPHTWTPFEPIMSYDPLKAGTGRPKKYALCRFRLSHHLTGCSTDSSHLRGSYRSKTGTLI